VLTKEKNCDTISIPKERGMIMYSVMREYFDWIMDGLIYNQWIHEDYENVTVYASINGDIICIERNEYNEITDAWKE
jgi:hypothetical protein